MSDFFYDKLPKPLNPNLAENNISRPEACAGIMKVFAQGHQAGLEDVDRLAVEHAIDVAYGDNEAYAEAYEAGYEAGRNREEMGKAALEYVDRGDP